MRKTCRPRPDYKRPPDYKDTMLYEVICEYLRKAVEIGYVIQLPCPVHGDNPCNCEPGYMYNQDLSPEQVTVMQEELGDPDSFWLPADA